MEKTERIDEQIKIIIISTKLFSIPRDSITKKIVKNCKNWLITEIPKDLK